MLPAVSGDWMAPFVFPTFDRINKYHYHPYRISPFLYFTMLSCPTFRLHYKLIFFILFQTLLFRFSKLEMQFKPRIRIYSFGKLLWVRGRTQTILFASFYDLFTKTKHSECGTVHPRHIFNVCDVVISQKQLFDEGDLQIAYFVDSTNLIIPFIEVSLLKLRCISCVYSGERIIVTIIGSLFPSS